MLTCLYKEYHAAKDSNESIKHWIKMMQVLWKLGVYENGANRLSAGVSQPIGTKDWLGREAHDCWMEMMCLHYPWKKNKFA